MPFTVTKGTQITSDLSGMAATAGIPSQTPTCLEWGSASMFLFDANNPEFGHAFIGQNSR